MGNDGPGLEQVYVVQLRAVPGEVGLTLLSPTTSTSIGRLPHEDVTRAIDHRLRSRECQSEVAAVVEDGGRQNEETLSSKFLS